MREANLKIIIELKCFIDTVAANRSFLNLFCVSGTDFLRTRKLPFDKLVFFIMRLCKKTLSIELEKFFEELGDITGGCSVSAFSQQRIKLKPSLFYWWNTVLWDSFHRNYGKSVKRWKGYKLIAADGSSVGLVNTPALAAYFGGQSNQHTEFIAARTFYQYDVLNELVFSCGITPYRFSELKMAYQGIDKLEPDMVTIYDRYFSNYVLVALHLWQETEKKFVIRARDQLNITKDFIASKKTSSIAYMKPSLSAIKVMKEMGFIVLSTTLLKVRLVRVELPGSIEVLITNLWEEEGHQSEEFKELYFKRWGVETNIGIQKNILQLQSFSGLTVQSVIQDFYATVLTCNLHSILLKDAQKNADNTGKSRKYPQKINKNKSFGKLKMNLTSLFFSNNPMQVLQELYNHFIKDLIPIRTGRSFPRVRKNRQLNSKHKTYTNYKPAA